MLACTDVSYRDGTALAACVLFAHWRAAEPVRILRATVATAAAYEPGNFYKRELPALEAVLAEVTSRLDAIVVDGYAWFGDGTTPGLGGHLYEARARHTAVIGVAKSRFHDDRCSIALSRGRSRRPLYVTAAGLSAEEAAAAIRSMHGASRVPTLLMLANRASRF